MRAVSGESQSRQDFTYTDAQWQEINQPIEAVRSKPISNLERRLLTKLALNYRRGLGTPKWSPKRKKEEWQRIAEASELLKKQLSSCIEHTMLYGRDFYKDSLHALDALSDEARREAKHHGRSDLCLIFRIPEPMKVLHLARDPERTARLEYEWKLMKFWTERVGGAPTTTWHENPSDGSVKGRVIGSLVNFFRAVTVPVMGNRAPNPYGIRDIAKRYAVHLRVIACSAEPLGSGLLSQADLRSPFRFEDETSRVLMKRLDD
jgi:hypothetical protein